MITQLHSAAPYIAQFQGTVFVVKIGGEVLQNDKQLASLCRQIRVLAQIGINPVVVHGAGPQLDAALAECGHAPVKIDGRRVTDARTLELAVRTFRGTANLALVSALNAHDIDAAGISGVDGRTLVLRRRPPVERDGKTVDFGLVGDPVSMNPDLLETLIDSGYVPAVCSLGADPAGQVLNINADTAACEIAVGLHAEKLIFVTDKPGVLHDSKDDSSIYSVLDTADVERLTKEGVISGGMLPKISAGMAALRRGVKRVHILGASEPDALLEETFTNQGCGTMLTLEREKAS